ncbi:MAG TPA: hypothetical protein VH278_06210 [Burkholderiaceae bacterium]|nr:hypothetical protein [Burkholderiaceae bacterium]
MVELAPENFQPRRCRPTGYVSGEQSSAAASASANAIHTLKVAADGTLSEPFPPTVLPISGLSRAQGVAVFSPQ